MVQTDTNTFYNREQEKKAKAQEREKREETRHAQMWAALQGSPMIKPWVLEGQGKCLICRQVWHWAKECPNHDKFLNVAFYKCHQLGHWAALCSQDPRASRSSTKPSIMMIQHDWSGSLQPVHVSQITIMGYSQGCTWMWQVGLRILSWHIGYLLCPDLLLWSLLLPNLYRFGCYRKNNYKQIYLNTSLLLGWKNIFPLVSGGLWVSYSLIGKRSFPAFEMLQLLLSW